MTKTIPAYLRIHNGPSLETVPTTSLPIDPVSRFWQTYSSTTGWRVDQGHSRGETSTAVLPSTSDSAVAPPVLPAVSEFLQDDPDSVWDIPAVSRGAAQKLAAAALELTRLYRDSLQEIRRQEAELAASAIPGETAEPSGQLVDRLQKLLSRAAAATGCHAAALYLLDEQTTSLKLRACYGLPASRLTAPARALRGSRGDLECLVRDSVLIDDLSGVQASFWNSPEPFPSAIVVRLEEEDLPVGTLWLWPKMARQFTPRDGAAAQLAATGIIAELSRAKLARHRERLTHTSRAVQAATQWQLRQLPPAMEIATGIVVDGWAESPRPWACSWHAWDVLPDGMVSLALAEADSDQLDGALIAATARAAFAAHSHYRHSVTDMLLRVSDSLWQTNTGDQIVSLLYAQFNPETGEGRIASAGKIHAIIASERGFRPVCSGTQSDPLGSSIDGRYADAEFRLQPGEVLVAVNAAVLDPETGLTQADWADCIRNAISSHDQPVLPAIRRGLAGKPTTKERSGVMLMRRK